MIKLGAVALAAGIAIGWTTNQWRIDAQRADSLVEVRKIERLEQETADAIARAAAAERAVLDAEVRVVTQDVIRYVQNPNTGQCDLGDDWVRTHDKAAGLPAATKPTARAADPAAADVTDRDALRVVAQNYAICRENTRRQSALISWYHATH